MDENLSSERNVALEAIRKKLRGRTIDYSEAYAIMNQFAKKELGEIFVAYFAAAGFKESFSLEELYYLTKAMVETGTKLQFSGIVADKHSIGGMPGTRTTLIIVPIIAAAGYLIPKTSSRAITTPAGTSDCMEVLANVDFSVQEVQNIVNKVGGCIVWNDRLGLAPADDIIIKVEEPLAFESFDKVMISILAKKIAASSKIMVLDIPVGPTMKIKYVKDAIKFGQEFKDLAARFGLEVKIEVNYQFEPAGSGVGPALEVIDALKVLEQAKDRPIPLEDKSLKIASRLLDMCYAKDHKKQDGLQSATQILRSGKALTKFKEIIAMQKGNPEVTATSVAKAKLKKEIVAQTEGMINFVNNYNINAVARILGAPNIKTAGLTLHKRFNQKVAKNDIILTLYAEEEANLLQATKALSFLPIFEIKN